MCSRMCAYRGQTQLQFLGCLVLSLLNVSLNSSLLPLFFPLQLPLHLELEGILNLSSVDLAKVQLFCLLLHESELVQI
jgi:hypothetical protein